MLLINQSFFIRDITIPNTGNDQVLERLNSFIAKYEPQCLLKLLGYPLYKLFVTEDSTRMTDLESGTDYVGINGNIYKWNGLVHDKDQSLIAYYIYYYFQEASATQSTGVNTSVPKGADSSPVTPADKMINTLTLS